jgi:hypothetical protein
MVYLSPRQQDIYKALREDVDPTITADRVKENYPSTSIQPRKKKSSKSKSKRKTKKSGCVCK